MGQPRVAVVILNWNGRSFLEQFLPSVLASTYSNLEVVVADNGSTDQSLNFLTETFPNLRQIRLTRNFGFTKGYNEALKEVDADYFVLLNSDVEVAPGWIEPMVELLEGDPRIAACQPKIRSYAQRDSFEYAGAAGGWIDRYGYPFSRGRVFEVLEKDHAQYDRAEPIFWATGAALFIRCSVYDEMHGFDESFFAHMEEIDLCWRIQLAGYEVWACPRSTVWHVGGGTLPRGNPRKTFLNFRNNHRMLWKNLPFFRRFTVIPVRLVLDGVTGIKALVSGDAGTFFAIIRAHFSVWGWLLTPKPATWKPPDRKGKLKGVYPGNVAWAHFVKKKKTFSSLMHVTA